MKCAIAALFCLYSFFIYAQDKKQISADSEVLAKASSFFINTEPLSQRAHPFSSPFDSIIFRDVRFDTTTIGATNKIAFISDNNKFHYIKLAGGLSGFLDSLFNNPEVLHSNSNADKLICYIKKFRITELDSTYETNTKRERQVQIRSAIEAFYFNNNKMYPAFRTDTTFLQLRSENKVSYFIIDSLFQHFTERLTQIDKNKILKRNSYSEEYIDSVYNQRFNLPILNTASFKKGVYTSAKEFFKNAPSITEYEWRPEKKVNLLYTKDENGQWLVTRKGIFGFCDGANIWLKIENSFYPAFRKESTFQFIAPLYLKRMVNNQSTTYPMSIGGTTFYTTTQSKYSSMYYQDKSVYEIDMETAELY
jgi:hypothetical protein